jgi:inhibitor of KinA
MTFPRFTPVADRALLVEFGDRIDPAIHDKVLSLDQALAANPPLGLLEVTPAYASLLITFDPIQTDHAAVQTASEALLHTTQTTAKTPKTHQIAVCYDDDLAADLSEVARQTGMSPEAVINAHLSGQYQVYLYGFAPGYAYLAGVPTALHLPRKSAAIRDIPAGRVIIAGPQCIVTTLKMPTGWWIIGASPDAVLRDDPDRPFLFDVGDHVRFHRIDRASYHAKGGR